MANQNNKEPKKEVNREDVVKYGYLYKEHFTEKLLVERAEIFVYNFCFNHGLLGQNNGWEGERAVYGQLPFGEEAIYNASKGKKVSVKAEILPDEEQIILTASYGKLKEQRVLEHLTIKHGYINWLEAQAPTLQFGEPVEIEVNPFTKNEIPHDTDVRMKQYRQPQPQPFGLFF